MHFLGLLRSDNFRQLLAQTKEEVTLNAALDSETLDGAISWRHEPTRPTPGKEKAAPEEGWNEDDVDEDCVGEEEETGSTTSQTGSPGREDAAHARPGGSRDKKRGGKRQQSGSGTPLTRRSTSQLQSKTDEPTENAASQPLP